MAVVIGGREFRACAHTKNCRMPRARLRKTTHAEVLSTLPLTSECARGDVPCCDAVVRTPSDRIAQPYQQNKLCNTNRWIPIDARSHRFTANRPFPTFHHPAPSARRSSIRNAIFRDADDGCGSCSPAASIRCFEHRGAVNDSAPCTCVGHFAKNAAVGWGFSRRLNGSEKRAMSAYSCSHRSSKTVTFRLVCSSASCGAAAVSISSDDDTQHMPRDRYLCDEITPTSARWVGRWRCQRHSAVQR